MLLNFESNVESISTPWKGSKKNVMLTLPNLVMQPCLSSLRV
jgi:hypothetical protein